jgi:hypothetical protein
MRQKAAGRRFYSIGGKKILLRHESRLIFAEKG